LVHFFTEDIQFDPSLLSSSPSWIFTIAQREGFTIDTLNFIFCSDSYLLQVNLDYLQHDYFTDIITFDNSDSPHVLEGDIFISIERVGENTLLHKTTFFHELLRVMAHGVLHLIGFDDKDEISKNTMRKMEDKYLDLYFKDFHKFR
jgi:probable rRNA maturation factor